MAFAKIFGTDDEQILVMRTTDSQGMPLMNLSFEGVVTAAGSVGLVVVVHDYADEASRDQAFDALSEEWVRGVVAEWRVKLAAQIEKEREQLK